MSFKSKILVSHLIKTQQRGKASSCKITKYLITYPVNIPFDAERLSKPGKSTYMHVHNISRHIEMIILILRCTKLGIKSIHYPSFLVFVAILGRFFEKMREECY